MQADAETPTMTLYEEAQEQRRQRIEAALAALQEQFGPGRLIPLAPPPKRKRRHKVKQTGQLSQLQRDILSVLVGIENEMAADESKATRLKNVGVPWEPDQLADQLQRHRASLVRALASLERRKLVHCTVEGEGRAKRYHHVRLTEKARAIGHYGRI